MSEDFAWFTDQVRREQARLRALIRALGVRAEAVDDLAQEAFLLAFRKLGEFDRQEDFGAWVRGIARRLVANALRKESRRRQILSERLTEFLLQTQPQQLHPLAEAAQQDRLTALDACLHGLPERSRHLLHLRYFEALTPGAIASQLNRSANEIRQTLFRLRKALLECIERRVADGAC
jgi:RNA polymerase sigma-70 factor (ECF subfamily)